MTYIVQYTRSFNASLKKITGKFPKSEEGVKKTISLLANNPDQGDRYPGFGDNSVRKLRLPLPEYHISKSSGLRLIFLVTIDKIIPLHIYYKPQFRSERTVREEIKTALKEILSEL